MNINAKKLERQLLGVDRWQHSQRHGSSSNGRGTLNYVTGVGKTYTAFLIFNRLFEKDNNAYIIVVVPVEQLAKDWQAGVRQHIKPEFHDRVRVLTAQKWLEDGNKLHCTLLCVDEIHRFLGEQWFKIVDGTLSEFRFILGLTATWKDKHNRQTKLEAICPIVDIISEEEALREGYVSACIEYNLALTLTDKDMAEYKAISKKVTDNINKFGKFGFAGASKVLSGGSTPEGKVYTGYQYALMWAQKNGWKPELDYTKQENIDINNLWNPNKIIGYAANLMEAVRERKDFLYTNESKIEATIRIVQRFPHLKTICFGQSTVFVDKLNHMINKTFGKEISVAYHSNLSSTYLKDDTGEYITIKTGKNKGEPKLFGKKTLKERAINAIRTGHNGIRILVTASAVDAGLDVEDIELGIIESSTSNPTQQKQRGGRVKRLKLYKPDTIVILVNLYFANTKDEDWLRERQRDSSNVIYWITDVEEIRHNYIDPEGDVEI